MPARQASESAIPIAGWLSAPPARPYEEVRFLREQAHLPKCLVNSGGAFASAA
jgi:hypothetical protein